jgi:predicted metal-dependent hydrolase
MPSRNQAQFQLPFGRSDGSGILSVAGVAAGVEFVRHRRARHYILRLRDDGAIRVTVPRGGSRADAERFLRERRDWIARERHRREITMAGHRAPWRAGTLVLLRGVETPLEVAEVDDRIRARLAGETVMIPAADAGRLRAKVEAHLRKVAGAELRARLRELADAHGFAPATVSIRNQRTRWGSCSPSRGISLNWRLVQVPPDVRDYVLLHELMHLRHLNHSARFWRDLARVCPHLVESRRWLRSVKLLIC